MQISIADNYYEKRFQFFKWNRELSVTKKVTLALFMACMTGIFAQIVIPLPWTPVPVTAQTFAVLMAGVVLGRYWGALSMFIYVALGLAGVPWFTGMNGGFEAILGATGGYLIGFILAALFLGHMTDKYIKARRFTPMFFLMLFANFALIYVPGLIGLGAWIYFVNGSMPSIWVLFVMGLIPFVFGDLLKIGGAAAMTNAITPKTCFRDETNAN